MAQGLPVKALLNWYDSWLKIIGFNPAFEAARALAHERISH